MPIMGIPYLVEQALVSAITSDFANSMAGVSIYDSLGAELMTFPAVRVEVSKGREQPENSGNFLCEVDIKVYGGMDPANTGTYIDATSEHTALCGNVHHWITATIAAGGANWLGNITDTDGNNVVKVHSVRLSDFSRDLNPSAGVFEDTFTLEIYAQEEPRT